jgi:hypothetical protein
MVVVYGVTLFAGAASLFVVELMIAKMVLPKFGGTPAVWNTSMVFFQAVLLGGYVYAHGVSHLPLRTQVLAQVVLLLLPLFFLVLPISVSEAWVPPGDAYPVFWVLLLLLKTVGLPFFVLCTMAPLMQKWFALGGGPAAHDPYFLYAASNAGSMIGLLAYPTLLEPYLTVVQQSWAWTASYLGLIVLTAWCGSLAWSAAAPPVNVRARVHAATPKASPPSLGRRLRWIALALVPSSLLLGVTTYLTTDIASIPLLWVIPLALYLLSLILVFSRLPPIVHRVMVATMPALILLLVFSIVSEMRTRAGWSYALNLATLFVVSMACHGELARDRPPVEHLTGFYLCLSAGGVLGGICNALIAPAVFNSVAEYPLALVLACLLRPSARGGGDNGLGLIDVAVVAVLGLAAFQVLRNPAADAAEPDLAALSLTRGGLGVAIVLVAWVLIYLRPGTEDRRARLLDVALPAALVVLTAKWIISPPLAIWAHEHGSQWGEDRLLRLLTYGLPLLLCLVMVRRPVRFSLGVGGILLAAAVFNGQGGLHAAEPYVTSVVQQERSFFGVLRVLVERRKVHGLASASMNLLVHGTTLHGQQRRHSEAFVVATGLAPLLAASPIGVAPDAFIAHEESGLLRDNEQEPLAYFHRTGPIGQIFEAICAGVPCRLAFIGLGIGSLASYVEPEQDLTFYEIDPAVVRLAEDPAYFTYLRDCRGRRQPDGKPYRMVLGDARLKLCEASDGAYRLLVVDAFSSDSIPIHLLTREAIALYMRKLAADGVLAFHITNRRLRLAPVLGNLAADQGLAAFEQLDDDNSVPGKTRSHWVVIAKNRRSLEPILAKRAAVIEDAELRGLLALMRDPLISITANPRYLQWRALRHDPRQSLWTDDFSNLLGIVRWSD